MHFKKIFAVLLIGCMLFSLAACGAKDRDVQSEHNALVAEETPQPSGETVAETPETTTPALPTATSEDVELYVVRPASSAPYVVNAYGQLARNYNVSDDGSIVDRAGITVVVSGNTKNFTFVTTADFGSRTAEVTLNAREDISDTDKDVSRIHQYPVNLTLLLTIGPEAATNRTVVLGSSNAGIVEVRANNNAKILADGAFELEPGELAIDVGETGNARIVVTAKTEGVATITARSLSGTATAECIVTVKNGEIEATSGMPGYDPDADPDNVADSIFCSGGAGRKVPWSEADGMMHVEIRAERQSGSGTYVMVEFEGGASAEVSGVIQRTTLRTDTLIASPSPWMHE